MQMPPQEPGQPSAPPFSAGAPWSRSGPVEDSRRKSVVLATVMSAVPGLGQVYVGYYVQGFVNALVVGSLIALLSHGGARGLEPLAVIFLIFYWLFNVVDAGRRAALYNHALAGLDPLELPEPAALPPGRGSIAGGVTLVLAGVILLSHTRFGLSLDWLERWWPMAFVLMGGYLVVLGLRGRTEGRA